MNKKIAHQASTTSPPRGHDPYKALRYYERIGKATTSTLSFTYSCARFLAIKFWRHCWGRVTVFLDCY